MSLLSKLALVTAAMVVMAPAYATPITFGFDGYVSIVDESISAQFAVGQSISGSYTFDSSAVGQSFSPGGILDPSITHYPGVVTALQFSIGSYEVSFGISNRIFVVNDNDLGRDRYLVEFLNPQGSDVAGLALDFFCLCFSDLQGTAFSSGALPLSPLNSSLFESRAMLLDFGETKGADDRVEGFITSMFYVQVPEPCEPFPGGGATGGCFPGPGPFPGHSVPEPGTLALLGIGLFGMGLARRRKSLG